MSESHERVITGEPLAAAHRWGELSGGLATARPLLDEALGEASAHGAQFADVRLSEVEELRMYAMSDRPIDSRVEGSAGMGVRVLLDGVWGFASLPLSGDRDGTRAAQLAIANARAAGVSRRKVKLPPCPARVGFYQTAAAVDPFAVAPSERESLVAQALAGALRAPGIARAQAGVNAKRQHRYFANSEGSYNEQHFVETGGMVLSLAVDGNVVQRRTYPNSFHGNTAAAGWEYVLGLELPTQAERVASEASALLHAPTISSGTASLVIGPAQLALQIHESTGHPLELDRILGDEANYAGRSFIARDAIGRQRYGSSAVNITADPTVPGTRGSFAFDDEGTPAKRTPLITEGIVTNFLSSRDSAARIGLRSTGAARSDGWGFLPLCFATHVFLEPGSGSTAELLERMGDGYYLDDNRSWSIDSKRLSFQFGPEVAWEVRHGRKRRLVRDFSYGGITPQFWGSVEAVAGPEEFKTFGMPCGKGEPKEWGFLSHGAAPMLVRGVRVGVA